MTNILLILHVLAVTMTVGPITLSGSMFPKAIRQAALAPGEPAAAASARLLHRICHVYAYLGLAVPVFGFATASSMHVLGRPWLITAITLTAITALVLALGILPLQRSAMLGLAGDVMDAADGAAGASATLDPGGKVMQLGMLTGVFNLLWVTIMILMILHPGSPKGGRHQYRHTHVASAPCSQAAADRRTRRDDQPGGTAHQHRRREQPRRRGACRPDPRDRLALHRHRDSARPVPHHRCPRARRRPRNRRLPVSTCP